MHSAWHLPSSKPCSPRPQQTVTKRPTPPSLNSSSPSPTMTATPCTSSPTSCTSATTSCPCASPRTSSTKSPASPANTNASSPPAEPRCSGSTDCTPPKTRSTRGGSWRLPFCSTKLHSSLASLPAGCLRRRCTLTFDRYLPPPPLTRNISLVRIPLIPFPLRLPSKP